MGTYVPASEQTKKENINSFYILFSNRLILDFFEVITAGMKFQIKNEVLGLIFNEPVGLTSWNFYGPFFLSSVQKTQGPIL